MSCQGVGPDHAGPEAVLALGNDLNEYVVAFIDQREYSAWDREFRISNRPRLKVQSAEILGVTEAPVQHNTAT